MKPTILLLYGGESPEHDVSIQSASNIFASIDTSMYKVVACFIDKQGHWWESPEIGHHKQRPIIPIIGEPAVIVNGKRQNISCIFPVLHGQYGEDGSVQGLAKLMHVPVVGCDIDGSAVCMDKILTKKLLAADGIPVVPFIEHHAESKISYAAAAKQLGKTLFIKPARLGSSVGVHKADSKSAFDTALKAALAHDSIVLIEAAIAAREIEVAVLGTQQKPEASMPGEITPDRDFYDYASKYDANSTSALTIPAALPPTLTKQIQAMAVQAFTTLRCQGLARVDFFVGAKNEVFINEVNTMPGFTNISMYPKLWEANGKPQQQLITELIELALARHTVK